MRNKRGQLSIFVILAVVLIAVGGVAYFVTTRGIGSGMDKEFFSQPAIKQYLDQIQNSVFECQQIAVEDSLDLIGLQGGYYKEPQEYLDLGWAFIPYYYKDGQIMLPEKTQIESELGSYVDDNLNLCLDEIKVSDFNLSYSKPKTKVVINPGSVAFTTNLPITVIKDDKRTRIDLKSNPISEKSKLYEMYEISKFVTDSHREDAEMLCISCVADMARDRDLFVDMLNYGDESTTLVVVSNNDSSYPVAYEFLNKYPVSPLGFPEAPSE